MIHVKRTLSALTLVALLAGCGGAVQESANPSGLQRVSVPTAPAAGGSNPNQAVSSDKTPSADQTAAKAPTQPTVGEPAKTEPAKTEPAKTEAAQQPQPQPAPAQPVQQQPPAQGSAQPGTPGGRLQFTTVQRGAYSGVSEQMAVLITDEAGWNRHWRSHASTQVPAPAAPAVDFSQSSLLAVYMGEKMTGGYSLEVLEVKLENSVLTARVRQIAPGPGDMVTMALTQPYQIIRLPRVAADTQVKIVWE